MIDLDKPPPNPRAWAHKIIARHKGGELVPLAALNMAREALGMKLPEPRQPG